jgi:hypothetical protein
LCERAAAEVTRTPVPRHRALLGPGLVAGKGPFDQAGRAENPCDVEPVGAHGRYPGNLSAFRHHRGRHRPRLAPDDPALQQSASPAARSRHWSRSSGSSSMRSGRPKTSLKPWSWTEPWAPVGIPPRYVGSNSAIVPLPGRVVESSPVRAFGGTSSWFPRMGTGRRRPGSMSLSRRPGCTTRRIWLPSLEEDPGFQFMGLPEVGGGLVALPQRTVGTGTPEQALDE